MFVLGNFISAAAQILNVILTILWWLILIRALLSFVNPDPFNPVVQLLQKVTEPILAPIRAIIPLDWRFGIDFSPLIAALLIYFLQLFAVRTLFMLADRLL